MTTLAALTENTLNVLYGLERIERPIEDTLDGAITTDIAVLVDTEAMWHADDFAEFTATDEVIRFAADASGATAVRRAQKGSTIATNADGAVMVKNPPFYRVQIKQLINEVIRTDLWPHVWTWHQDTLTPSKTDFVYDLDAYIDEVAIVYQYNIDSDNVWRALPPGWWDVERQMDATVATNAGLLVLRKVWDYDETIYYTAKRRPHPDDLSNLADAIADMIPWAAAAKALAIRSGQIKNAAARSEQDQSGGLLRDYRGLMSEFIRMRTEYNSTLLDEVRQDQRWRPHMRAFGRTW